MGLSIDNISCIEGRTPLFEGFRNSGISRLIIAAAYPNLLCDLLH